MQANTFRAPVTAAVRADLKAQLPMLAQAYGKRTPSALIEHLIQQAANRVEGEQVVVQTDEQGK